MNVAVNRTPAEAAYIGAGALVASDRKRREAYEQFIAKGLPHRRMEDWRWTDLRQIINTAFPPALAPSAPVMDKNLIAQSPFYSIVRARLVLVDGLFMPGLSTLPASGEVEIASISDMMPPWLSGVLGTGSGHADDPILSMNTAFMAGGVGIRIAAAATVETPIEIVSIVTKGEPRTLAGRVVLVVEDGASAAIIETHLGAPGAYVNSSVTEAFVGANARLDRLKVQLDGEQAIHLANCHVQLKEGAILRDCTVTQGGATTRQQGFITFAGSHADAKIAGAYLLRGKQHCDTRLVVDHRVPNCISREVFKCIIDEAARGIFQGKVIVQRDAQKTDGKQSSHGLLLSPTAEFDAKPELEIYADDVVCGHGATAGDLDEDLVFYLRTRGIPLREARALLVSAFAAEAFEDIAHDQIRDRLEQLSREWLQRRIEQ
ncbi:MAG TPA: Fe-S cluster assembly protein SufD [Aestuariivirgaceae bacterium]|jgi:Fe-S cluster assembly protein SufD